MIIHPTSIVHAGARLAKNVIIGPYALVEQDVEIGEGSNILGHAVIKQFTSLGPSNLVHEGAVLGGEPQDIAFTGCTSYLRIGSNNRIREAVTMHRGTQPQSATIVGSNCFLMVNVHIAHNCRLGDGIIVANNVALAGYVEIEDQAFLSSGVVVHQFCRIGRLAMIGGHSKIVQDCLPFVITDGDPGRARGLNVVGLRKAGVTAADIQKLKEGYRLLLRSGLPLEHALQRLADLGNPLVDHLISFVRNSTRGFCHEDRKERRAKV